MAFDAPQAADLYYRMAVVLKADGRRAEAIEMLTKADKLAPTSAKILRSLAVLAVATGAPKDAIGYYGRLIELFPDAADIDELRNALRNLREKTGAAHATSNPDDDGD